MGVLVNVVGNLVHAWQRVENAHVGLGQGEHVVFQDIDIFHPLIFHEVGEALLLHARHVEDVGIGDDLLVERRVFLIPDAVLLAIHLVFAGHGQFLGSHEVEGGVEVSHGHEQGVHGAPVFQVAHHVDVEVVEGALRLVDAIEVEHALRGMLVCAVAGIDDGHGGHLGGILRRALYVVAHDDDVGVVRHHEQRVLQRLALGAAGHFGVGKADDARTEAVGGRLEAEACARGRLEEKSGNHLALEELAVGVTLKLARHLYQVEDFLAREVGNGDKIMFFHSWRHLFRFTAAKLSIIFG